jgi:hypothetical protein
VNAYRNSQSRLLPCRHCNLAGAELQAAAARLRRCTPSLRNPDPISGPRPSLGEHPTALRLFPVGSGHRTAGIPASHATPTPKGYIASSQLFPGLFL